MPNVREPESGGETFDADEGRRGSHQRSMLGRRLHGFERASRQPKQPHQACSSSLSVRRQPMLEEMWKDVAELRDTIYCISSTPDAPKEQTSQPVLSKRSRLMWVRNRAKEMQQTVKALTPHDPAGDGIDSNSKSNTFEADTFTCELWDLDAELLGCEQEVSRLLEAYPEQKDWLWSLITFDWFPTEGIPFHITVCCCANKRSQVSIEKHRFEWPANMVLPSNTSQNGSKIPDILPNDRAVLLQPLKEKSSFLQVLSAQRIAADGRAAPAVPRPIKLIPADANSPLFVLGAPLNDGHQRGNGQPVQAKWLSVIPALNLKDAEYYADVSPERVTHACPDSDATSSKTGSRDPSLISRSSYASSVPRKPYTESPGIRLRELECNATSINPGANAFNTAWQNVTRGRTSQDVVSASTATRGRENAPLRSGESSQTSLSKDVMARSDAGLRLGPRAGSGSYPLGSIFEKEEHLPRSVK